MQESKRAAQQAKDLLSVCVAKAIDQAMYAVRGPQWFAAFYQEDQLQERPILKNGLKLRPTDVELHLLDVIPAEELASIEAEANSAVWSNLTVKCWYPSEEELPSVFYRTKRALPWPVRIVEIPGWDSCACCGIHVGATGEVGLLKIFSATMKDAAFAGVYLRLRKCDPPKYGAISLNVYVHMFAA